MIDHGTCPRCKSALRPNSHVVDGVVWDNEQCTGRGCIYETNFRLVSTPIRHRPRPCQHSAVDIRGRCPICPAWGQW